jgi:hypothetical protein
VCETGLLLAFLVFHADHTPGPTGFQLAVFFGQVVVIPGMAALFSCFLHGPIGRVQRVFRTLAWGVLSVSAIVGFLVALALTSYWVSSITSVSTVAVLTFVLLLLLLVCSVLWGTFVLVRKARRSIQVDADNWLASRSAQVDFSERRWKVRGVLVASWIPLLMVLCVFLFLPEIWGVLSHVATPRAGRLPGYQVPIPETWIVLSHNSQPNEGGAWVAGLAGRGMGRGMSSYLYRDFPLSEWSVGILPHTRSESETAPRIPNDARVLEKRTLKIGNETITCVDFSNPYPGWEIERHSTVFVKCSGSSPVLQASLENGCMSKRSTECWKASLVRNHCHPKHNCASNLYSRSL